MSDVVNYKIVSDFFTAYGPLCIAAWVLISLCLIVQHWLTHRDDSTLRKLFWSFVLLFPLAGWVLYGGLYRPPSPDANAGHADHGRFV